MVDRSETRLVDLLGRQWALRAPVKQVTFDQRDATACFVLADDRIALAPLADADPAEHRYHIAGDDGRATITPRRKPVPPLTQAIVPEQGLQLARCGPDAFLVAATSGAMTRLAVDGALTAMVGCGGPVHALAALPHGAAIVAAGNALFVQDAQGIVGHRTIVPEAPRAPLAATDDGRWIAHGGAGMTVRAVDHGFPIAGTMPDLETTRLAWSPDGRWLAAALVTGGIALVPFRDRRLGPVLRLTDYPTPVLSLSWDGASQLLATSGAFRIVIWPVDRVAAEGAEPVSLPTGRAGLVAVDAVALHPQRSLVAAAYANGMVVVAQIGSRDELVVRPPSEGTVDGLCWTRNGEHLAFGTTTGDAAIVSFPPQMFKSSVRN